MLDRHRLDSDHRSAEARVDVDELFQRWWIRIDHIVAENDAERFVTDQTLGDEHGVTQPEGFTLTHVRHSADARHLANFIEQFGLASPLEDRLQFEGDVEVVLHRALAAAGDDGDVLHA